jgi:hypothetical protein
MAIVSYRLGRVAAVVAVVLTSHVGSAQQPAQSGERAPIVPMSEQTTADLMALEQNPLFATDATDATTGLTFSAISLTEMSSVPADGSLAAGPTQILAIANGRLRSFDKATGAPDGVVNLSPNTFFSTVRSGGSVFGGRVRFDRWTGRWVVTMTTDSAPSRIVLAVSDGAVLTASTVWRFSGFGNTFGSNTCTSDPPTLAIDSLALYLGVNQFCGGAYAGTSAFVVRKSSTVGSASLFVTAFHNLTATPSGQGLYAPRGADNPDVAAAVGYLIGVDNSAFGRLVLRRVNDPAGVPTLSADITVNIAVTAPPVPVPHLGNTQGDAGRLDAGDDRLMSAVVRGGRLYAVHGIGLGVGLEAGASRNGSRWYVLDGINATPVVSQSGTLAAASGDTRHFWNPSLAVSGSGRVIASFNTAGPNDFINAAATDRETATSAGVMTSPVAWTSSTSGYNPSIDLGGSAGRRWGRYSETVTDGCDDRTIWALQAYGSSAGWTLQVGRFRAAGPAAIASVTPTSIASGEASIDLVVTTVGGMFADAPTGFLCRLTASIPGVTVNSVTLLSDTSVRVNVSTLNATPGVKPVTVTNADGQSTAATDALTVRPGTAMALDGPIRAAQPLLITGWALDGRGTSGVGIDSVVTYAYPLVGDPILLGAAVLGQSRPDVAAVFGPAFRLSGFSLRTEVILPAGTYNLVTFAHSAVTGELIPREVSITVSAPAAPFGTIDTPTNGVSVAGELAVTGWALDAAGVRDVRVYRDAVAGEPSGLVLIGVADFVRGARPDVQTAQATLPNSDRAGWGLVVLTNVLPNLGNGTFVFSAYATNLAGVQTLLGQKTVTGTNATSVLPFGTIDTPGQGAEVSGTIVSFGWVLTPSPLGIPFDGSTIDVFIDNVLVGHPVYNQYRADIATLFPGYANSNGAVGYFVIDTTRLANGVHTIGWAVRDNAGRAVGIGSRFFRVNNGS